MRPTSAFLAVPITSLILATAGCHRAYSPVVPLDASPTVKTVTEANPDCVWESIQETLRQRGFRLDRVDREAGVITTMPETSQHFFEFWRRDVDTRPDFWEASFNTMRRWVQVTMTPSGTGADVTVIVHKERLSSLDRQFNSTGAAYKYFGAELPATTGQERVTPENDRWVNRGRDLAMEQLYLAEILDRARTTPG